MSDFAKRCLHAAFGLILPMITVAVIAGCNWLFTALAGWSPDRGMVEFATFCAGAASVVVGGVFVCSAFFERDRP